MSEKLDDETEWGTLSIRLPPELVKLKLGPDLIRFFDAMIYKFRRNAHKGRWEDVAIGQALVETQKEMAELAAALKSGSSAEILMEAADVANWAVMLANISLEVRDAKG